MLFHGFEAAFAAGSRNLSPFPVQRVSVSRLLHLNCVRTFDRFPVVKSDQLQFYLIYESEGNLNSNINLHYFMSCAPCCATSL